MTNVMTREAREELIRKRLAARETGSGENETYRLEVLGESQLLPVVNLPVDAVLLNPRSHRIQAEIESHPKRDVIEREPFSEGAQSEIEELLRQTEQFEDLRRDLRESGQREPGVVTRAGLLVNANRRTVALRELESDSVRVAVLPPGVENRDIDRVELQLQMSRDYMAEYTFTNRLKFIDDWRTKYGVSDEKLARYLGFAASDEERELKRGAEDVQREARLLTLIRDVQQLADHHLPLTFFNDKRQTLIEVDKKYQSLKKRDPKAAVALRNAQLISLFLKGSRYRTARKIEEGFYDGYLVPAIEDNDLLRDVAGALTGRANGRVGDETVGDEDEDAPKDLGLDVLGQQHAREDEEVEDELPEPDPQALLGLLSRTAGKDIVTIPRDGDGSEVQFSREMLVDTLDAVMDEALEELDADNARENRLDTPIDRLREAEGKVKKARQTWKKVRSNSEFGAKKFEMHAAKLSRSTRSLHEDLKRYMENDEES